METQTQSQVQTQIIKPYIMKSVIDLQVVEVPKHVYNTIRSFVDSSSRSDYPWNVGIRYGNTVKFVKPGKWTLIIYLNQQFPLTENERTTIVELLSPYRRTVLELMINGKGQIVLSIKGLKVDGIETEFIVDDMLQLLTVAIINKECGFARPITIYEIILKLREYVIP